METKEREIAEQNPHEQPESAHEVHNENQAKKPKKFSAKSIKSVKKAQLYVIAGALAVIVLLTGIFLPPLLKPDSGKVITFPESSLQRVLETSNLTTLSFTYNAITPVYNEKSNKKDNEADKEIKYHVAYEGQVTAGLDITKITISTDKVNKTIRIILPEIEIQDVSVNMGTLDFIFQKSKYETSTVSQEAYQASCDDLLERANAEASLMSIAKENAVNSIKAIITPWKQAYEEYTIEIQ